MTIIHALNRKKRYDIHIIACDAKLTFTPNEHGDAVCDVQDSAAVDWLLSHAPAFKLYGDAVQSESGDLSPVLVPQVAILPPAEVESPYILKDEQGTVMLDLRIMSDEDLHALAKENGIKVHHSAKGDTIRDKIVQALTAGE